MINRAGEVTEDEKERKKVYNEFYQTLLRTKEAVSTREKEAERDVNKMFNPIEAIAKQQETLRIEAEQIRKVAKKLKRRKANNGLIN